LNGLPIGQIKHVVACGIAYGIAVTMRKSLNVFAIN